MAGRRLVVVAERDHSFIDLDDKEAIRIGRAPDNEVVVKDDMVSRHHATIECLPGGAFRVRDLKSFNGTYLNERRVRDEAFVLWDAVRVGRTKLFLVERGETPPSGPGNTRADSVAAESSDPAPADGGIEAEGSATKTLDVNEVLGNRELRSVLDDIVRREREELERQIAQRVRDESGPSLLASLTGYKARVRRIGPGDGGGDFFDVFRDPSFPADLQVGLGSVSGVGIAASVAATVTRHSLRGISAAREATCLETLQPLREVLSQTLHPGSALSLLLARMNKHGKVQLAALGGCGAMLYVSARDEVDVLRPPGRRDEEAARVVPFETQIKSGDRLLLLSDGAGAIRGAEGEPFGSERLAQVFADNAKLPLKELLKALLAEYETFSPTPERDVTLLVISDQASAS